MDSCEFCLYAEKTNGKRVIVNGSTTIVQNGENNINCTYPGSKTVNIKDKDTECSAWTPKDLPFC